MAEKYKMHPKGLYFVTLTVVGGIDVFTRHEYCDLLIDNLNYFIDHKRLRVYEYAILPGQLCMIVGVERGSLPKVLRDFKSYSARNMLRAIAEYPQENRKEWLVRMLQFFAHRYQHNAEHHFWQFGNHPVNLDKWTSKDQPPPSSLGKVMETKLIDDPRHYIYCSAYPHQRVNLSGMERERE